ncbi:MAG: alanine racemase [Candidatus Paceibacterota bacterium]|jgi:alanine racemase
MIGKNTLRTWVEIDTKALAHNYQMWRRLIGPKRKFMAVIKSNAYGHGLVDCAKIFSRFGADWLGVDAIEEAITLRQAGIKKPTLVLGYTCPANFMLAVANNVVITISSFESLNKLVLLDKKLKDKKLNFHLKVNTGMNRQGFSVAELDKVIKTVTRFKNIKLTGVYSHLASPCDKKDKVRTEKQISLFKRTTEILAGAGYINVIKHFCATGGTAFFASESTDLVRVGLGLYGFWPDMVAQKYLAQKAKWFSLKPALTWKAVISETRLVKKGEAVGYNFTHVFKKDSRLAICAVGYWHGYGRVLSNRGYVVIKGKKVPVVGRVCMDMIIVDVSQVSKVRVGDEVIVMGPGVTAYDFAKLSETSPYEVITRINPDIPRLYI